MRPRRRTLDLSRTAEAKPTQAYLDTELRILHSKKTCPYAKMAYKYNYITDQSHDLVNLPAKAKGFGWKACPKCGEGLI